MPDAPATKWFSNLYYASEWTVQMNAYKINSDGLLSNGSEALGNYSAKAIFSSTVKYLQFPTNLTTTIINYILYDKVNQTYISQDAADG